MSSEIKAMSWMYSRSHGLTMTTQEREGGEVVEVRGHIIDPDFGIVLGTITKWWNGLHYSARTAVNGRSVYVSQERPGKVSTRSLSIWLWRHALPAIDAEVRRHEVKP